jgi:hypothetical protein
MKYKNLERIVFADCLSGTFYQKSGFIIKNAVILSRKVSTLKRFQKITANLLQKIVIFCRNHWKDNPQILFSKIFNTINITQK